MKINPSIFTLSKYILPILTALLLTLNFSTDCTEAYINTCSPHCQQLNIHVRATKADSFNNFYQQLLVTNKPEEAASMHNSNGPNEGTIKGVAIVFTILFALAATYAEMEWNRWAAEVGYRRAAHILNQGHRK